METSPSRSRVIFIVVFLIIFSAFITFLLITLTNKNKNNLPKENPKEAATQGLCAPFAENKVKISCEEAVKKAMADTKGKITKITIGKPTLPDEIKKILGNPKEMWLIDIVLEKPTMTRQGKEIKALQIGIPTDETGGIIRTPI